MHIRLRYAATLAVALLLSPLVSVHRSTVHAGGKSLEEITQARIRFEEEVREIESKLQESLKSAAADRFSRFKNLNEQLEVATLNIAMEKSRTGGLVNGRMIPRCANWAHKAVTEYESKMEAACKSLLNTYGEAVKKAENHGDRKTEKHLKRELARVIHFRDYQLLQPVDRCIADFRLTADSAAEWSVLAKAYSHEYRLNGELKFPLTYAVNQLFAFKVPGWERDYHRRAQWPFVTQNLKDIAPELEDTAESDRLLTKWALVKTVSTIRRTLLRFGSKALVPQAQQYIRYRAKDLYAMRFDLNSAFDEIDNTRVRVTESNGKSYERDLSLGEELSQKLVAGLLVKLQHAMMDAEAEKQFLDFAEQVAQFEHQVWFHLQDRMSELPRSSSQANFSITADYKPDAFPEALMIENVTGGRMENVVVVLELRFRDQVDPWVLGCFVEKWEPHSKVAIELPNQFAATLQPVALPIQLPVRMTIADGLQRYIDQPLVLGAGSDIDSTGETAAKLQLKPAAPLTKPSEFFRSTVETIQRHNACVRDNERFIAHHVQDCLKKKQTYTREERKVLADDAKRVKDGHLPKYILVGKEATIATSRNRVLRELSLLAEDARHQGCTDVAEMISAKAQEFTQSPALKLVSLPSTKVLLATQSPQAIDIAKHFDDFVTTIEARLDSVEKQLLRKPHNPRKPEDNPEVEIDELRANGTLPKAFRVRERTAIKAAMQKLDLALTELTRGGGADLDAEIARLQSQLKSIYGPLLTQLK